jgi:putative addiction module killer protein
VIEIKQTESFKAWWTHLRDDRARALVAARLNRLAFGLLGDVRAVGEGVSELRIHYGAGYRIYFVQRGLRIVVLLCGGDKSSQQRDIKAAKRLAAVWRET